MHISPRGWFLALVTLLAAGGMARAWAAHDDGYDFPYIPVDHTAIEYKTGPLNDPVARLERRIDKGEVKLDDDARLGYLPSLLKHLGLNADSQMLVFSKTSF